MGAIVEENNGGALEGVTDKCEYKFIFYDDELVSGNPRATHLLTNMKTAGTVQYQLSIDFLSAFLGSIARLR